MDTAYKEINKVVRFNPVKFLRMICLILILVTFMSLLFRTTASGSTGSTYKEVVVARGDTLWKISKDNSDNENIQKVIYEIMEINKLNCSDIYPGQILKIP